MSDILEFYGYTKSVEDGTKKISLKDAYVKIGETPSDELCITTTTREFIRSYFQQRLGRDIQCLDIIKTVKPNGNTQAMLILNSDYERIVQRLGIKTTIVNSMPMTWLPGRHVPSQN